MYIETIRIQDGRVRNIGCHEARCNRTRKLIYKSSKPLRLRRLMSCPQELATGTTKCRISYAEQVIKVEYEPYQLRDISSLKLMQADDINYEHKAADRSELSKLFSNRGRCDDILMIKDGLLTDTYYGNIALKKNGTWYTPRQPMLAGTMRARLLSKNRLKTKNIAVDQLVHYESLAVFNAMIPMGKIEVKIDQIY